MQSDIDGLVRRDLDGLVFCIALFSAAVMSILDIYDFAVRPNKSP